MNYNDSNIHEININSLLRKVDLNLLLVFDVLMQEQNVTRAAERVFLTQSAMSNALKRLRELFDDPILIRGAKGMQPTLRAKELESPIRAILIQAAQVVQPAKPFNPSTSRARFVVGMNDYSENVILPKLAVQLNKIAPHVEVAAKMLSSEPVEKLLESGELNIVIAVDAYSKPNVKLDVEAWINERLVCVVSQKNTLAKRKKIDIKNFLKRNHVYPSPLGLRKNIVDMWLADNDQERKIAITTRSYWAAAQVTANSDYILSLPLRVANALVKQMPLHILQPPAGFPGFQLNLVTHPLYKNDVETQWLVQQLKALDL